MCTGQVEYAQQDRALVGYLAQFIGDGQCLIDTVAVGCEDPGFDADIGKELVADRGAYRQGIAREAIGCVAWLDRCIKSGGRSCGGVEYF